MEGERKRHRFPTRFKIAEKVEQRSAMEMRPRTKTREPPARTLLRSHWTGAASDSGLERFPIRLNRKAL